MKALPSRTIKFRNLVGAAVVRKVYNNKKTLAIKKLLMVQEQEPCRQPLQFPPTLMPKVSWPDIIPL
jgi:hypothetical protein